MNNYKQRYETLTQNIEEIKNNKKEITSILEVKETEYAAKKNIIEGLKDEMIEMELERNSIVRRKEKIIDMVTDTLILALLAGTIVLGVFTYNAISPMGLIIKLLTIIGLTSGGFLIFSLGFGIIKKIDIILKKKNISKNKNNQEYLSITKKINEKNKKLVDERKNLVQISKELDKLENEKNNQELFLSSKEKEFAQLIEEIVQSAIKEETLSEGIVQNPEETSVEEKTKPHTKIKGIGHRR